MEICVTKTIYLRSIPLGWQDLKKIHFFSDGDEESVVELGASARASNSTENDLKFENDLAYFKSKQESEEKIR